MVGGDAGRGRQPVGRHVRQSGAFDGCAGVVADGGTVLTGDGERDAGDQRIDLGDWAAGDDGECVAAEGAQAEQLAGEVWFHGHLAGGRCDVQQGAVQIEQEGATG